MRHFLLTILALAGISLFLLTCKKNNSTCITCPPPLDTTSHLIQWQAVDTLGAQGLIRDVWVFSRDNALAVGEIYLNDSTGKPDMANPYNAAQWDGLKWTLKQIPFVGSCSAVNYPPIHAIWAFASNNILMTNGGSIVTYDGVNATMDCRMNLLLSGAINKIYAVSPQDIYLVGNAGTIIRYNGSGWTKMTSNTSADMQDIWGIDATHIWATGFNEVDGHSAVLQCNGTSWAVLYDNTNKPPNQIQYFNTLWTDNTSYLYLDGGSFTNIMDLHDGTFKRTDSLSTNEVFRLRGITHNDIFRVGYGGETVHYNGVSWYLYPELRVLNGGAAWFYSVFPTRDMVVIGGFFPTTLNGFPVVIRGYR